MSPYTLTVENEGEMRALAVRLAQILITGDVLTLEGDLGAGKTSFTRALVNALSPREEEVPSPTFTLLQVYDQQNPAIWHFDLYRIEKENDILELGWEEARRQGVAIVEWPDRLGRILPKDRLEVAIAFGSDSENQRQVTLTPYGSWLNRERETS